MIIEIQGGMAAAGYKDTDGLIGKIAVGRDGDGGIIIHGKVIDIRSGCGCPQMEVWVRPVDENLRDDPDGDDGWLDDDEIVHYIDGKDDLISLR